MESIDMKHKEKEYLIAFKLYIDNYGSRYRYPKYIKANNKKDAITKYIQIIKPDLTLGACIIMDERPVKQDETADKTEAEHSKNINDVYREGNLKLLEMMISQLNNSIDPTKPNHAPKPDIVDMVAINEELCSTSRLADMLSSGAPSHLLPYNGCVYTDDFFEHVRDYINDRYNYDYYNDYTLMKIRDDLQCMYDNYNEHGILPWETKKDEDTTCGTSEVMNVSDFPAVVNREDEDKTPVIKIIKQRTDKEEDDSMKEKKPIAVIEYAPQFDISAANINLNFPYILEIDNICTGVRERHVVVITKILINCIYCNQWDNVNDNPHSGIVLTASAFHERNGALYKITGEDLIEQSSDKDSVME